MLIEGICFDFGNTLVMDPLEGVLKFKSMEFRKIFRERGYDIGFGEIAEAWGRANDKINYPFISHFYQERPIILHALDILKIRKEDRKNIASQLLITYREGLKSVVKADKRIQEAIAVLKEIKKTKKIMVFSNDRVADVVNMMKWTGMGDVVGKVMVSESLEIEKPDPRVFMYILKILGTGKERTAYVGDDPKSDIEPAKKLGMHAILFMPKERVKTSWRSYDYKLNKKHSPDFVIHDLGELLEILE